MLASVPTARASATKPPQATLASAWDAYLKTTPPEAREAMRTGWMAARAAALGKAGFDTIFD